MADGKEELQNDLYFNKTTPPKHTPRRLSEQEKQNKKTLPFKKFPYATPEKLEDYLDQREQLQEDE